MKKIITALFVILSILMVVSFSSCSFQEERIDSGEDAPVKQEVQKPEKVEKPEKETESGEDTLSKEEVDALASVALEKLNTVPEYPEGFPTLEAVVAQYERANEAIGWIIGTEKIATDSDYTHEAYGMTYSKVLPDCYLGARNAGKNPDADMLIYNKETFEAYLATLIDADEAHDYVLDIKESFDIPKFVESKNGELYALPYAFPAAGYGEEDSYELIPNADGSYTLKVTYTLLDDEDKVRGESVYNAKYVKKNGRWVFENFRVVKQH